MAEQKPNVLSRVFAAVGYDPGGAGPIPRSTGNAGHVWVCGECRGMGVTRTGDRVCPVCRGLAAVKPPLDDVARLRTMAGMQRNFAATCRSRAILAERHASEATNETNRQGYEARSLQEADLALRYELQADALLAGAAALEREQQKDTT